MLKDLPVVPFRPDTFVGGDDPATTTRALTNLNAKLELQAAARVRSLAQVWHALACYLEENGGQLAYSDFTYLNLDVRKRGIVFDTTQPGVTIVRLIHCDHGATHASEGQQNKDSNL